MRGTLHSQDRILGSRSISPKSMKTSASLCWPTILHGQVVVAGGPFDGEPWPTGMLNGPVRTLRGVSYRVITPEAQIEIKLMMPIWDPGRPRRLKDREDVKRIRRALESRELP